MRRATRLGVIWLALLTAVWGQATLSGNANVSGNVLLCAPAQEGSATPILVPNIGATGDNALAEPSPVLAFGKQGTNTSSMALPISISNCSNAPYEAVFGICGGAGSLTVTGMTISGTNASDFALTGSCGAIASGSDCEPTITFTPTAAAGTNETATLTVSYSGAAVSTQTMSLTGTSATVTTLSTSSCPTTLSGATNYQLVANISCAGSAFTLGGSSTDINLNGYTVTYGTGSQSTQIFAFGLASGNFSGEPVIHNGTITKGSGTNSFSTGSYPGSSEIGSPTGAGWGSNGSQFFNLTFNLNFQYANAIDMGQGGNFIAHDNIFNDTAVGTCASVGCRSSLQSALIVQFNSSTDTTGTTQLYNNTVNGGPQGGFMTTAPSAVMSYNTINPGNTTGTNTNNFALNCWGKDCVVAYNSVMTPLTSISNARGITINASSVSSLTGADVYDNISNAYGTANNSEYGGCGAGGTYAFQIDDNPVGPNTVQDNAFTATANPCGAGALRVTDSEYLTNESENNTYIATRQSGAGTCSRAPDQGPQAGCANASEWDGPTGFTSLDDTFTGDSCDVLLDVSGASGIVIQSPVFNQGSNPSDFHTFCAENGTVSEGGGPVTNFHVIDATFNTGTTSTDTDFPQYNVDNQGDVSLYIDWTQTMQVNKASGPAASGAVVTWTDTLSNTYTCTTNSGGQCSVALTQYRNNNDTAANQHENRNPYSLSVPFSGCTTYSASGITISATGSRTVTLSGC